MPKIRLKLSRVGTKIGQLVDRSEAKLSGLRVGKRVVGMYGGEPREGKISRITRKPNGDMVYVVKLDKPIGQIRYLKFNACSLW